MDGILIIDKPAGITSHDVVNRVRRALGTKRVGHTGTLDPFATGVMVVLVGRATRLAQYLDKDEKEYEAEVAFGFETDTGDRTGTRIASATTPLDALTSDRINAVLPAFRGDIEQVPPMFSAKKIEGRKLYELARRGETIERKAVVVTISRLEIASGLQPVDGEPGTLRIRLVVACSAGTYIRTLAADIGRSVGAGAHLAELRRTRAGRFTIADAVPLDDVNAAHLRPAGDAVEHLPRYILNPDRIDPTRNGMSTRVLDAELPDGSSVRLVAENGELIAIGRFAAEEKSIQPRVVL